MKKFVLLFIVFPCLFFVLPVLACCWPWCRHDLSEYVVEYPEDFTRKPTIVDYILVFQEKKISNKFFNDVYDAIVKEENGVDGRYAPVYFSVFPVAVPYGTTSFDGYVWQVPYVRINGECTVYRRRHLVHVKGDFTRTPPFRRVTYEVFRRSILSEAVSEDREVLRIEPVRQTIKKQGKRRPKRRIVGQTESIRVLEGAHVEYITCIYERPRYVAPLVWNRLCSVSSHVFRQDPVIRVEAWRGVFDECSIASWELQDGRFVRHILSCKSCHKMSFTEMQEQVLRVFGWLYGCCVLTDGSVHERAFDGGLVRSAYTPDVGSLETSKSSGSLCQEKCRYRSCDDEDVEFVLPGVVFSE